VPIFGAAESGELRQKARPMTDYPYVWRWRIRLGERYGWRCKILVRGRMNTIAVEFEADGHRVITSRWAVRKIREQRV
jgi:hypothetical protein